MKASARTRPASVDELTSRLAGHHYIADRPLAVALYLSLTLGRPLLLEGEAGVGKTEVAATLAAVLDARFIRLQCYEGLDVTHAVYEWNYARQLLDIRMREASGALAPGDDTATLFREELLIKRPLLQAIEASARGPVVLLIDEIDRADEEFEGFLLEFLAGYQVTIPELGTIRTAEPPAVLLTSNRTRELHDALKRRCLYCWIDFPDYDKEYRIILERAPQVPAHLAAQSARFVQELRRIELYKTAGVSETLDWVAALVALDQQELDERVVDDTLGILLKHQDDILQVRGERSAAMVARARLEAGRPG